MSSSALHSIDGQAPKVLKPLVVIAEAPPHPVQGRRMSGAAFRTAVSSRVDWLCAVAALTNWQQRRRRARTMPKH
eukprot:66125-Chlamydomonas_euryale.AAC.1